MFSQVDISGGQVSGVSSLSAAASSVVNWTVDEAGANRPRAALAAYSLTDGVSSTVNGLFHWGEHLIVAYDGGRWQAVPDSVPTTTIDMDDSTSSTTLVGGMRPTFVAGESYIYAAAGGPMMQWQLASGSYASQLVSSPLASHIATLGSYLIANDLGATGTIRWSDIGEGSWGTWPAANVTTPSGSPDAVVAIAANTHELFVWGTDSLQVYELGSDPTLPFDLASTIDRGIAAPSAFLSLDGRFVFLDDLRRIVISDGRSIEVISDAVALDLRSLEDIDDAWIYREEYGQHSLLVVRFPTEERTFVYDLKGKKWTERKYYETPFQDDYPAGAYWHWKETNTHVVGSTLSAGGLFSLDGDSRTENSGVPIVCERVTGWHDHGSKARKRSKRIRAVMQRGTSTDSDISDQGALEIRVQDDDRPWGDWESVPVGDASEYENTIDIFIGGIFKRRRYAIRYSSSEETTLAELYEEFDEVES